MRGWYKVHYWWGDSGTGKYMLEGFNGDEIEDAEVNPAVREPRAA